MMWSLIEGVMMCSRNNSRPSSGVGGTWAEFVYTLSYKKREVKENRRGSTDGNSPCTSISVQV